MDYVQAGQVYRQRVQTRDETTYPGSAALPDEPLSASNFSFTVNGVAINPVLTVTPEEETGSHLISFDTDGIAVGAYIEMFCEWEVLATRYTLHEQIFVTLDATALTTNVANIIKSGESRTLSRSGKSPVVYTETRT